jgi:Domain of unknown function (DUF1992)
MENPIDRQFREAMQQGKFDDLPGKGRPMNTAPDTTPEELRLGYTALKNAGYVPEEAEWLREIAVLKERLAATTDDAERNKLRRAIQERQLKVSLFLERYRSR